MAIPLYLAMTAREYRICKAIPMHMAWMACHFSSYGTGLSNLPSSLPENSMIIVNDRTPIHGHDPRVIADQLNALAEKLQPRGILLDFQRPDCQETLELTQVLVQALTCPVCVSEIYAQGFDCPVFLPPPKVNGHLKDHLAPWAGHEIWLEAALDHVCFTVTEKGCSAQPQPCTDDTDFPYSDSKIHCHYRITQDDDALCFSLRRTRDDLTSLLDEAAALGVTKAVGLWQELN